MPKATDKPLDMDDARVTQAIDMTFAGRFTGEQIAQKCSISRRTYVSWLKHPDFQAALADKRADFKRSIERVTFSDKARRIYALNDSALIALADLEERPKLKEVRPTKDGFITNEAFNNAAMAEFRAALDDIAKELGERASNLKLSASVEYNLVPSGELKALADEMMDAVRTMPEARERLALRLLASGE